LKLKRNNAGALTLASTQVKIKL